MFYGDLIDIAELLTRVRLSEKTGLVSLSGSDWQGYVSDTGGSIVIVVYNRNFKSNIERME